MNTQPDIPVFYPCSHLHMQKKKKIIKGEPPTISNHSIRAQQFSLSFALQKRTRGGEVFEKHTSILYHFISWQKNNFSPLSAQQGSHCPKRFNSLWVKRKRLFYSDTLYPGYIKQNQRRHLHTVSVSCVRSFRQEQLSLRIKEGGFTFLNWAERGKGESKRIERQRERDSGKRLRKEIGGSRWLLSVWCNFLLSYCQHNSSFSKSLSSCYAPVIIWRRKTRKPRMPSPPLPPCYANQCL